jgi:hypothetical protein
MTKQSTDPHRTNPSPLYKDAVRALSKLLEKEGTQAVSSAHAEAVDQRVRTDREKMYGHDHGSLIAFQRLIDGKTPENGWDFNVESMGLDHSSERWKPDSERADMIESQPYSLTLDELRAIIKGCDEMGLEVRISGESWHLPGKTLLVEFTRADQAQ